MKTIVLIAALLIGLTSADAENPTSPVEFQIADIDNQTLDTADLRGQWVAVNFWATWCKPCRHEIPDLDFLHQSREDVTVIGLAFEEVGPEEIKAFLEEIPASYPIALVDVYEPPEAFGIPRVLPTTVLLNPQGHKVKEFVGPVTSDQIIAFIDNAESRPGES